MDLSIFQKRVFRYEIGLAVMLLFMPIILILFDGGIVRDSISDYVYMKHNQIYFFLLFVASTMFANNGALWVKRYNILLGISLAIIALTPHKEFQFLHFSFAALFFLGSVFVMIVFSSKKQRIYKIYAGILILLGMLGHYIFDLYSLFYAEWIGIVPICIHFIGESSNKVD
jgi:hypothetical protein